MRAGLKVDLLGTMRVLVDGEPLPKMRSRKAKWLLAFLALRDGEPVGRASVAGLLWPDTEIESALANLRSVVSDLRRALGSQADRLRSPDRRTLAFDFRDVEIDALAFDAAIRAKDLETAIGLYAGTLLQDCDEEWAGPERNLREGSCLAALHELAEMADPRRAVALSQRAIEVAPWQDGPRRDLMTAYVRAGDLNAALAAYRDFAQALRAEKGGAPDPQTTDLYVRLRSGTPRLGTAPSGHSETTIRTSLPHVFSSFVGREDERVELVQAIRTHRLVTLTGVGGIGKTRLAREVAVDVRADFPDGVGFVTLEAVDGEAGLVHAVLAALRIKLGPKLPPLELLIETLRYERLLLVLDNCEHLVPACARLANRLLGECPELRILATSREPLCLVGERVWPVPSLTAPDRRHLPERSATLLRVLMGYESVRLFVERAQTAAIDFELTCDNALAVADLCAILEGSPLALELAAGRVRTMSVPEIFDRFGRHRLDFLAGNRHAGTPRHQTLRAALDWSYSLLGAEERRLFARFAIFADGWTMEAAEQVVGATPTLLESLVEKSLVVFSANGRYNFLETVRQYAAERLAATGDLHRLRERHVDYYAELAESLAAAQAPHEAYEREMGNFNAVMDRRESDPARLLYLAKALHWYWSETYAIAEGARRIEDVLARSDKKPSTMRAHALRSLAMFRSHVDRVESIALHEESLRIWRELDERPGMVRALSSLGLTAMFLGETDRAIALIQESIDTARGVLSIPHVASMLAYGLNSMALVCVQTGDYGRTRECVAECLDLMRKHGRPVDLAIALRTESFLKHDFNDYAGYQRLNEEALEIYRANGNLDVAAWCLVDLGIAATELGQTETGQGFFEEALAILKKLDDRHGTAWALESLGTNAVARGAVEEGISMLKESLAEYRALGYRFGIARSLDSLGDALAQIGDPDANDFYREGLAIWREMGARKRIRDGLIRIADGSANISLWAGAYRLGEAIGAPIPLPLQPRHERAMQAARSAPGFEADWATGREMPLDAILDLAALC